MSSARRSLQERRSLPPLAIFALLYMSFQALLWHTPHASATLAALVAAGGQLAAFTLVAAVPERWANDYVMPLVLLGFLGVAFSTTDDRAPI